MRMDDADLEIKGYLTGDTKEEQVNSLLELCTKSGLDTRSADILQRRLIQEETIKSIAELYSFTVAYISGIYKKAKNHMIRYMRLGTIEDVNEMDCVNVLIKYNASVRLYNCLMRSCCFTLEDFVENHDKYKDKISIRDMGKVIYDEWTDILNKLDRDYNIYEAIAKRKEEARLIREEEYRLLSIEAHKDLVVISDIINKYNLIEVTLTSKKGICCKDSPYKIHNISLCTSGINRSNCYGIMMKDNDTNKFIDTNMLCLDLSFVMIVVKDYFKNKVDNNNENN